MCAPCLLPGRAEKEGKPCATPCNYCLSRPSSHTPLQGTDPDCLRSSADSEAALLT